MKLLSSEVKLLKKKRLGGNMTADFVSHPLFKF